jgi:hypothetical protein
MVYVLHTIETSAGNLMINYLAILHNLFFRVYLLPAGEF